MAAVAIFATLITVVKRFLFSSRQSKNFSRKEAVLGWDIRGSTLCINPPSQFVMINISEL
jgi:hypothetical protein